MPGSGLRCPEGSALLRQLGSAEGARQAGGVVAALWGVEYEHCTSNGVLWNLSTALMSAPASMSHLETAQAPSRAERCLYTRTQTQSTSRSSVPAPFPHDSFEHRRKGEAGNREL